VLVLLRCSLDKTLVRSRLCREALAANAKAAFVPSSSVRNHMRSEQGKLYATRIASSGAARAWRLLWHW
jgi:hypothetical protein